tara:strand:- start:38 stop:550 length:513 start_codon:yes stop_codon:yes gene_type:complete
MTNSKVDTKALEEMNNVEATQTADILFDQDKLTVEALELLVSVYGTDDQTAKQLARQFCSGTHFMIHGNDKYNGISYYTMSAVTDSTRFEQEVQDNIAGAQGRLDKAVERRNIREAQEQDIKHLHKLCCKVYKSVTGEKWEASRTAKPKAQPMPTSQQDRLKALMAKRAS